MRIAITGGSGMIGQRLVGAHLARGDAVRVLSRQPGQVAQRWPGVTTIGGDLAAADALPAGFLDGVDVLYHCAAELRDAARMDAVNVAGTARLIDLAAGRIRHWVQLSSVGVYGPYRDGSIDETAPLAPQNRYEQTKAEADRLLMARAGQAGFTWTLLRPSNVYSPQMSNRSLFQLIAMIDRGLFFFVGPRGASANYIHAQNVVEALLLCAAHPAAPGRIFNLSDYRPLEDFVATIAAALERRAPARRLPEALVRMLAGLTGWLPGNPLSAARIDALTLRSRYDTGAIEHLLGYRHRISMEDGLREMVGSYRHGGAPA